MVDRKEEKNSERLIVRGVKASDGQASPVTILAIALAGGAGYLAWRFWKQWQKDEGANLGPAGTAGSPSNTETGGAKTKSGRSPFAFDKQPAEAGSGASTSGRTSAAPSSSRQSRSRQEQKPKSQKQLRKEEKQAKKAAKEQAVKDAANAQVANAIAKRAKELGMGPQPQQPEPPKQYFVDYDGVTKAYDKIVEWQQTGKKKF